MSKSIKTGRQWLAGWYATRLHAVESAPTSEAMVRSACGAHVYAKPKTEWAARRLAKGPPFCKACLRILERGQTTYFYEVTYKQNGQQTYNTVRASSALEAVQKICADYGDVTPVSVSRVAEGSLCKRKSLRM